MSTLMKAAQILSQFSMAKAYSCEVYLYGLEGDRLLDYEIVAGWIGSGKDNPDNWDAETWAEKIRSQPVLNGKIYISNPNLVSIFVCFRMKKDGTCYRLECTDLSKCDGFDRIIMSAKDPFRSNEVYLSAEETASIHNVTDVVTLWNKIDEVRYSTITDSDSRPVFLVNYRDPRDRFRLPLRARPINY